MSDAKRPRWFIHVSAWVLLVSLFLYPIVEGYWLNLFGFLAWFITIDLLILAIASLFVIDASSIPTAPRSWYSTMMRMIMVSAILWLAAHGAFVLASLVALQMILFSIMRHKIDLASTEE